MTSNYWDVEQLGFTLVRHPSCSTNSNYWDVEIVICTPSYSNYWDVELLCNILYKTGIRPFFHHPLYIIISKTCRTTKKPKMFNRTAHLSFPNNRVHVETVEQLSCRTRRPLIFLPDILINFMLKERKSIVRTYKILTRICYHKVCGTKSLFRSFE